MSASPRLRRASGEDAAAAANVWLRSRHASVPAIPAPVHDDDDVRGWFADAVIPGRETWVAEADDNEIVAVMVISGEELDQLYVDPQWTRRGVGSRMIELAKSRSPSGLDLWTFEINLGARRFYARHGFAPVERTDGTGNEERAPDLRYRWPGI